MKKKMFTYLSQVVILGLIFFASSKTWAQTLQNNFFAAQVSFTPGGADQVTSCLGTEPFWQLEIAHDKIQFSQLGEDKKLTIRNTGPKSARGALSEFISLYQGRTLENESQFLNVIIQRRTCSDRMSDTEYPFIVSVLSGSSLYSGCCR